MGSERSSVRIYDKARLSGTYGLDTSGLDLSVQIGPFKNLITSRAYRSLSDDRSKVAR